ncbi:NAD(P)-binding domain-containing protein [Saccharothrix sp.]|uniref:imine reductase family protein n=1 Tax=Saccharothrix sp. TaxID=1873460 RepID=UPI0028116A59|nr:NAD(P)-binding domain-containing protein [Saccharothrix sp.]
MNRTPVTVIGLGSMGRALAEAFVAAGHPTTVWNRTPGKVPPGAVAAGSAAEAVAASPLIVACLSHYDATTEALADADLSGRSVVTLNSGTPSGARRMGEWAVGRKARFLDGAIKNVPAAVGAADTQLYYSGDESVYAEHEATLRVLGGDTSLLGTDVDLAKLYEYAVGGTLLPALLGFFQGAALVTGRGRTAASLVPHTAKWLDMIASVLPTLADEIDRGEYTDPQSSVGVFHDAVPYDHEVTAEAGLDVSWHQPMHDLLRRAVEEGRRDQSIAALVELLREPA